MDHTMCNPATSDICGIPRSAWDWDDGFKGKSVISEFGLECSSSFLRGLPTSTFNVGAIFGGVFMAMIPDGFLGRKQLLFFTTLAMSITGISIYFSSNIWIYAFLKFVVGRSGRMSLLHVAVWNLISFPTRFLDSCLSLHVCSRGWLSTVFSSICSPLSPLVGSICKGRTKKPLKCLRRFHLQTKGQGCPITEFH
ncbi:unnamed protein product [Brassica rapa subsp. narinosa]